MRRKIFLILCGSLSALFLCSYCLIYFILHSILFNNIERQQTNLANYNATIFANYINSFNMASFQFINDKTIGNALNEDNLTSLDRFRAKEAIRQKLESYFFQQFFSSNLESRFLFFLNQDIPLSAALDHGTLMEDPLTMTLQFYSDADVSDTKWYQKTLENVWSPYFFFHAENDELCYAKCVQNYFSTQPSGKGVGVIVICIPIDSLIDKLSLDAITPNSSVFLLNQDKEILYTYGSDIPNFDPSSSPYSESGAQFTFLSHTLALDSSAENGLFDNGQGDAWTHPFKWFSSLNKNQYISHEISIGGDIYMVFLTPFSDIVSIIQRSLRIYLLISLITFAVLILITYVVSRRFTAPIISFAHLLNTTKDANSLDLSPLAHFRDKEIRILYSSFSSLIQRENTLIEKIKAENIEKRNAMLQALQAQINPHFLYNALDAVSWIALSKNEDEIADILSSIVNMMRYNISVPDAKVTVGQEIDNIYELIRISQLEYPIKISLDVLPAQEDLLTTIEIPKFTLQPLAENAILHNLEQEAIHITITIQKTSCIKITVTDDGIGADPDKLNAFLRYEETDLKINGGFGIRNVNERLHLYYANDSELSYAKTADGKLSATLMIKLS